MTVCGGIAREENVDDLEEVFGRNAQCAYEPILHRARHFAEASLVVLSFEDVDFGDGHLQSPSMSSSELSGYAMVRAPLSLKAPGYTCAAPASTNNSVPVT
jgi:hypothetical protein